MNPIRRSRATSPTSPAVYSPRPKPTIKAAVFVVHGMGSQVEGYGKFDKNIADLRKTCGDVLLEDMNSGLEADEIAWIPIEWHSVVHGLSTVDARMHLVTLPTTPVFRQINNDMLADVLYFFSSFHGAKIMEIVAGVINSEYSKFKIENPEFDGPICILAHSLGGIITYDLLANQDVAVESPINREMKDATLNGNSNGSCRTHFEIAYPKLDFKPHMLVTLGSQVAAVMIMRGQSPEEYKLPPGILYRNVFHLYDPLAYRIEPLIDARYAEISPVLIQRPSSLTKGFNLAYYRSLSKLFSSYLPSIPNELNFQSMLPAVAVSFPQFGLPDLGFASHSFPDMLIPKSFSEARKTMIESMYSFTNWGIFTETSNGSNDVVAHAGTKRSHDQDVNEIDKVSKLIDESGNEEGPKHKRRRVDQEENHRFEATEESGSLGIGKFGRKILKPRASKPHRPAPEQIDVETRSPIEPFGQSLAFEPSPTALADGVMETIRGAVRRMSAAFNVFDDEQDEPVSPTILDQEEEKPVEFTHMKQNGVPEKVHRIPSQQNVEEALTEEFAAAAERALKRDPSPTRDNKLASAAPEDTAETNSGEKPLPLKERLDYFVTESVMENTVHQYFIGMKAHFSYWGNKDMMFHILSTLLDLRNKESKTE